MSFDLVSIAKQIFSRVQSRGLGTGRTHIMREGIFASDRNPILIAPTKHQAVNELHGKKHNIKCLSFRDVENGALLGLNGPFVLSHTAQEELIQGLLSEIDRLEDLLNAERFNNLRSLL